MIDASEVREDDETYMNPIDRLFEALEKKEPTHFAVKQYKKYKLAAGVIELRRTLHYYWVKDVLFNSFFIVLKGVIYDKRLGKTKWQTKRNPIQN